MSRDFIHQQITKLSGCRMANHSWNGKTHDSSQKNHDHSPMDSPRFHLGFTSVSPRFHIVEIIPKWKLLNAINHIEYILQPSLELRLESVRRHLIIQADNAKFHTAKKSQEFCEQISLRIAPNSPYSLNLVQPDFFYQDMWSIVWMDILILRKEHFLTQFT
jgi:hypothetical protein